MTVDNSVCKKDCLKQEVKERADKVLLIRCFFEMCAVFSLLSPFFYGLGRFFS